MVFAIKAVAEGRDHEQLKKDVQEYIQNVTGGDLRSYFLSDEEDLIGAIMNSKIRLSTRGINRSNAALRTKEDENNPGTVKTEGPFMTMDISANEILTRWRDISEYEPELLPVIEAHGIKRKYIRRKDEPDKEVLILNPKTVTKFLLRGDEWGTKNIKDILLRIAGAKNDNLRIDRQKARVVTIPVKVLKEMGFMADEDNDESQYEHGAYDD